MHHARALFLSLAWLLPCERCRDAYSEHLRTWPFPKAAGAVQRWVFDLHNHVNRRTGASHVDAPSWETVRAAACASPEAPEAFFAALITNHPGAYKSTPTAFLEAHEDFWAAAAHFYPEWATAAAAAKARSKTALRRALKHVGTAAVCNAACVKK